MTQSRKHGSFFPLLSAKTPARTKSPLFPFRARLKSHQIFRDTNLHGGGARQAGDFSPGRYLINANFRPRSRVNGSSQGKIHSAHSERQNSFRSDICNICGGKLSGQTNTRIYARPRYNGIGRTRGLTNKKQIHVKTKADGRARQLIQ